jgi:formylglycine-generating enzyme required for sulfatase activity
MHAPVDGSAYTSSPEHCQAGRIKRGGSWFDVPLWARSAFRYVPVRQHNRNKITGSRVARTLD